MEPTSNPFGMMARPFLKWAGGKRRLLPELLARAPKHFVRYHEPFLGGGALFFALRPERASLADAGEELVNTFQVVQSQVEPLLSLLRLHQSNHSPSHFYATRGEKSAAPLQQAARMIYLNKTCFNGLFRLNAAGQFNVAMGQQPSPEIVQADRLRACAQALQGAEIACQDFRLLRAQKGDFVYFDPPYDGGYTGYTPQGFTSEDQADLAALALKLHGEGVQVLLSNADTPYVRSLYREGPFRVEQVRAPRSISCCGSGRKPAKEILITNTQGPFQKPQAPTLFDGVKEGVNEKHQNFYHVKV